MPEFRITKQDVESLGAKLGRFESTLSEDERALLVGILSVAAEVIGRTARPLVNRVAGQSTPVVVDVHGDMPAIRDQFVSAFTPGARGTGDLPGVSINIAPS